MIGGEARSSSLFSLFLYYLSTRTAKDVARTLAAAPKPVNLFRPVLARSSVTELFIPTGWRFERLLAGADPLDPVGDLQVHDG
jgi:hypothetical protein